MSRRLIIEHVSVANLKPYGANARVHSPKQIAEIAASIEAFGFNSPVLVDKTDTIIAGHGRVAAAKKLGLATVPVIRLEHLTDAQKRAYILADNKLAERAGWDRDILAIELQHLTTIDTDFDVTVTGFEMGEIDLLLSEIKPKADAADVVPPLMPGPAVIVIPLGLAVLATEFIWARRWLRKARKMFKQAKDRVTGSSKKQPSAQNR